MTTHSLELGRSVKRLQNFNHRRLETGLREIDTTLAQWDALRAIEAHPGASGHALAEETFQTDQSFGTLATRMIANGLLERHQGAGRALIHTLTPKGKHILAQGQIIAEQVIGDSFGGISEAERIKLLSLLRKVLASLHME
ncbi:MarR family winged helix-turn-helix transcriptional regulator [Undibacterium sp. TJN19]|uniref:MarR family winged helix-turn-helix transcriptional regulator n=1 Tax=Undibacterium sp. TJN19 TaxID=3413055 RepID=UPI003BF02A4A